MSKEKSKNNQDIYLFIENNVKGMILSFIVIFTLIFIIVFLTGIDDVISALSKTNLWILGLTFIIEIIIIILWSVRWKYILNHLGSYPNFLNVLRILIISQFGKNVTPGSIGGEPLRAYLLTEYDGTDIEVSLASTFISRAFELLPFMILSIVSAITLFKWNMDIYLKIFFIIFIILMIAVFNIIIYIGVNKKAFEKLIIKLLNILLPIIKKVFKKQYNDKKFKSAAIEYIDNFSSSFRTIIEDKKFFLVGAFSAFMAWVLDLLNSYLVFYAIGINPPVLPFIIIFTVSILISFIPMLPGSLGITEIIMITLFAPIGIAADYVFAASTLERLSSYIFPTMLGIITAILYKEIFKE